MTTTLDPQPKPMLSVNDGDSQQACGPSPSRGLSRRADKRRQKAASKKGEVITANTKKTHQKQETNDEHQVSPEESHTSTTTVITKDFSPLDADTALLNETPEFDSFEATHRISSMLLRGIYSYGFEKPTQGQYAYIKTQLLQYENKTEKVENKNNSANKTNNSSSRKKSDVIFQAPAGSGKTCAAVLAAVAHAERGLYAALGETKPSVIQYGSSATSCSSENFTSKKASYNPSPAPGPVYFPSPSVLYLVPSREAATQVTTIANHLSEYLWEDYQHLYASRQVHGRADDGVIPTNGNFGFFEHQHRCLKNDKKATSEQNTSTTCGYKGNRPLRVVKPVFAHCFIGGDSVQADLRQLDNSRTKILYEQNPSSSSGKKTITTSGGGVAMCVGTVGRIADLIKRGALDCSNLTHLIVDDADALIKGGSTGSGHATSGTRSNSHTSDLYEVFKFLPKDIHVSLVSTTMLGSGGTLGVCRKFMRSPIVIAPKLAWMLPPSASADETPSSNSSSRQQPINKEKQEEGGGGWSTKKEESEVTTTRIIGASCNKTTATTTASSLFTGANIKHHYVSVEEEFKMETLADLLVHQQQINVPPSTVIFVKTSQCVDWLIEKLRLVKVPVVPSTEDTKDSGSSTAETSTATATANSPPPAPCPHSPPRERDLFVSYLHEDMWCKDRQAVLQDFLSGRARVLITTDMFARGIDVHACSVVIQYQFPLGQGGKRKDQKEEEEGGNHNDVARQQENGCRTPPPPPLPSHGSGDHLWQHLPSPPSSQSQGGVGDDDDDDDLNNIDDVDSSSSGGGGGGGHSNNASSSSTITPIPSSAASASASYVLENGGVDTSSPSSSSFFALPVYLHRAGRCGRWGRKGVVISLLTGHEEKSLLSMRMPSSDVALKVVESEEELGLSSVTKEAKKGAVGEAGKAIGKDVDLVAEERPISLFNHQIQMTELPMDYLGHLYEDDEEKKSRWNGRVPSCCDPPMSIYRGLGSVPRDGYRL